MTDSPSISSSGYTDGLGRREIGFDRETGTLLERLYLRPEIGVFEAGITGRVDRLQALDDERFARPMAVERDGGRVVVVSEYVAGVRISDLLEMPDALQDAPTLDLALAFLLEALPALGTFHTASGGPHGLISTGRTVLASSPKVVFLDGAFGDVIGSLHYSRARLWREFGLAIGARPGSSAFGTGSDVAQVALIALMLVLGRTIREDEYLHGLSDLVSEVADVALIRGSDAFATGLQQFLRKALPLSSQSYRSAEDALADVRRVAELEMGTEACSRALTAFIGQIDVGAQPLPSATMLEPSALQVVEFDDESLVDVLAGETSETDEETPVVLDAGEEIALEQELVLDAEEEPAAFDLSLAAAAPETSELAISDAPEIFDPAPAATAAIESFLDDSPPEPAIDVPVSNAPERTVQDPFTYRRNTSYDTPVYDEAPAPPPPERERFDEPAPSRVTFDEPAPEPTYTSPAEEPAVVAAASAEAEPAAQDEHEPEESTRSSFFSPRRRREDKSKSARARKDKLRSAAAAFKETVMSRVIHQPEPPAPARPRAVETTEPAAALPPPPPPKPAAPPLIPAHRAAAFEPPIPEPPPAPAPRPFAPVMPQSAPIPAPPPAAVPPAVPFSSPPMPVFNSQPIQLAPPTPVQAPPPIQLQGGPAGIPLSPSTPALKLKTPISIAQPTRRQRNEPPPLPPDVPRYPRPTEDSGSRQFPWKLAAAAVIIILAGVVAGRAYLPDRKAEQERAAAEAAAIAAAAKLPPAKRGPAAVPSGKITIDTQPPGAKVLLDGLAAGQTPVTLDSVPAGKHVITLISESGSVKRTVKVEAGQTVTLSESIFGGWVAIFAPITFEVAEKGRLIGNTEEGRLMLSPGRHELTLTNKALGYSAVHTVDIEPGEVRSLTLEPKGAANFNAVPWAEVWVNDQKIGDTPIANWQLPLGVHNIVFKNPSFGERRVTATIRANEPVALSVDFNR